MVEKIVHQTKISHERLEYVAKNIDIPNKSFEDTINYFIKKYNAVPYQLDEHEYKKMKANVILARFPQLLPDIEIDNFGTNLYLKAMNYPEDHLDLRIMAYMIPNMSSILEVEFNTEYMQCLNDDNNIINELLVWKGVGVKDVSSLSGAYIAYVNALCECGVI